MNHAVIAPFSNSDIRDWPAAHYRALIARMVADWDGLTYVVGAPEQAVRAREIVRAFDSGRVINACGRNADEALGRVRSSICVIGNNSGIAHLAAFEGVPTICVFGGAHQRMEWRPIGRNVVTLSRAIACSPCHFHHAAHCPYGLACLEQISPDLVFETFMRLADRVSAERFADVG
jgi:ADP-heptose:LPS heptosyltransferase